MKYIIILILAFSISLQSQTTVKEEYLPYDIDSKGEVVSEILVFVVKSDSSIVARFFPEIGRKQDAIDRANLFAKNYKKDNSIIEYKPKYIVRRKGKIN